MMDNLNEIYMVYNISINYDRQIEYVILMDVDEEHQLIIDRNRLYEMPIFTERIMRTDSIPFVEGDFVYVHNGMMIRLANDSVTAVALNQINFALRQSLIKLKTPSLPHTYDNAKCICSYHINVGHGNCSIIVFEDNAQKLAWMIDCSEREKSKGGTCYRKNIEKCLNDINSEYGISKISKLFITHLHYDHINGINYLLNKNYISGSYTEIWLNYDYQWGFKTYNDILARMSADKFRFILPIYKNSTDNIKILSPIKNFCSPTKPVNGCIEPPDKKINNSSVIYQFKFGEKSMVFPGDVETGGWEHLVKNNNQKTGLKYYCISHHGSYNGLCNYGLISTEVNRLDKKILMGRDGAYPGIFCNEVKNYIRVNTITTDEKDLVYIKLDWDKDIIEKIRR